MDIFESTERYESWLRDQLGAEIVEPDLIEKREKMRESAFVFLRATYWRWAEIVLGLDPCSSFAEAPQVLAVGDIHIENFGTWRDEDGRLIWGINDFDEAAVMPFAVDLVRLAASAVLARARRPDRDRTVCDTLLSGYLAGLRSPRPFCLDRENGRMREIFDATETERERFWKKIDATDGMVELEAGHRFRTALLSEMPDGAQNPRFRARSAGTGSLGRPRWTAVADWQGGEIVREAKAIVPSAWGRLPGRIPGPIALMDLARGRHRAPDPWYRLTSDNLLVRRLSPNARKIGVEDHGDVIFSEPMMIAMGHELANAHLGQDDRAAEIEAYLQSLDAAWLADAVRAAADVTTKEYKQWCQQGA